METTAINPLDPASRVWAPGLEWCLGHVLVIRAISGDTVGNGKRKYDLLHYVGTGF